MAAPEDDRLSGAELRPLVGGRHSQASTKAGDTDRLAVAVSPDSNEASQAHHDAASAPQGSTTQWVHARLVERPVPFVGRRTEVEAIATAARDRSPEGPC